MVKAVGRPWAVAVALLVIATPARALLRSEAHAEVLRGLVRFEPEVNTVYMSYIHTGPLPFAGIRPCACPCSISGSPHDAVPAV